MKKHILLFIGIAAIFITKSANAETPGLRIIDIQGGSIYETLGLKAGDTLTSFNQKPLTNEEQLKQFYNEMLKQTKHHISLHLIRDGKPLDLEYEIKQNQQENKLLNEPCGRVTLVKYGKDEIEVILRPTGAKANRGEIFNKTDFDLNLVSQVALKALESKSLLFCARTNKDNKLEFYTTR